MAKTKMRDIVIILPGIMGSVLQKDNKDLWAVSGQAAWGALKSLGGSFQQLKLNGDERNTEFLDGIIPTRLVDDAHIVPGFVKIDGYTQTKKFIIENFDIVENKCFNIRDNKAANFFEFPYDWRRDIRVNAKILKRYLYLRLQQWREFSGAKDAKVILLAHSMGGLVSRYCLEVLECWPDAKALFTFGTPYRGSPMAVNFLANGYKNQFLDLTEVVRSLPGAYELLPIYEMLNVDGKNYRIAESPIALPNIDRTMAEDALKFHREIEAAVNRHRNDITYLRDGYKIVPFVGTDQPTTQSVQFVNGQLKASRDLPIGFDPVLVDGDGTVPYISAVPIELSDDFRSTYLVEQHGSLQNHPKVLGELRDRIRASQAQGKEHVRGEIDNLESKLPAIRLMVDDLYLHDESVNMLVQLVNFDRDPGGVIAKISSVAGTTSFESNLQEQGQDWQLELGDLPAGFYRVNLRTGSAAPGTPSPVTALFEVVK